MITNGTLSFRIASRISDGFVCGGESEKWRTRSGAEKLVPFTTSRKPPAPVATMRSPGA